MEDTHMRRLIPPILAILSVCAVLAQDVKKPQEPEYVNVFFLLEKDGSLKPLERLTGSVQVKAKKGGFGGGELKMVFPNEHSSVRLSADLNAQFVVRLQTPDTDPTTLVQFYSLKVVKGQRELQAMKAGFMSGGSKSTLGNSSLPFEASKHGDTSALIKPQNPLPAGEYLLTVNQAGQVYCFGVDPAKP
jgi:hypothetical protein